MPAIAKLVAIPGAKIRFTPATKPLVHSRSWSARCPAWLAVRAAEHAVSYELQGPFSPST
eukprot:4970734-Prymnesium_polylepis.6